MNIVEPKIWQDFRKGTLEGEEVEHAVKLWRDAKQFYHASNVQLPEDEIMYEVFTYSQGSAHQKGNLNWGLTLMKPVYVNKECNMTRGHYHEDLACAEFYFCLAGEGLLLLMNHEGECWAEAMKQGSVHHIDGTLAHRLVNTGQTELAVGACWPSSAGHDYERIEKQSFPVRVFKEDEIVFKKKTDL